jgi:hypothetical protein
VYSAPIFTNSFLTSSVTAIVTVLSRGGVGWIGGAGVGWIGGAAGLYVGIGGAAGGTK